MLAALVPAVLAARQPVVASLLGRRVPPVRTALPTVAGLVLLVAGAGLSLLSLRSVSSTLWIAFCALPTVIGAVLLAPVLLAALGRFAGRLPLALRYAVRDADRQRSRTAPAVAAIAATVTAAVAPGVANTSDTTAQRRAYTASGAPGVAVVTTFGTEGVPATDWAALAREAERALPGESVTPVPGLRLDQVGGPSGYEEVQLCLPGSPAAVRCDAFPSTWSSSYGASVLVGQPALEAVAPLLSPAARTSTARALAGGAVVVFDQPVRAAAVDLRRQRTTPSADGSSETSRLLTSAVAPAVSVPSRTGTAPAQAIVPAEVARRLGGVGTVALAVGDDVTEAQQDRLGDALSVVDGGVSVSVERGYRSGSRLVLLLLGLGAGGLVLAGTLAATSLALVESRPDFVTLGQVGSRSRTRRAIAGAYAAVLAVVGGLLGTLAGMVTGVAAAVALTRGWASSPGPSAWTGPPGQSWTVDSEPERARSRRQALLQRRLLLGVRRTERLAASAGPVAEPSPPCSDREERPAP